MEKSVNRLLIVAALLGMAALPAAAQQAVPASYKVGIVSTERVMRDSRVSLQARKLLEDEYQKRDAEIVAGPAGDVARRREALVEDMNQRREAALKEFIGKTNLVIQRIAAMEHFDIVLFEAAYANPRIDLTDKVIKELDGAR
jgi:outer membrane protein